MKVYSLCYKNYQLIFSDLSTMFVSDSHEDGINPAAWAVPLALALVILVVVVAM